MQESKPINISSDNTFSINTLKEEVQNENKEPKKEILVRENSTEKNNLEEKEEAKEHKRGGLFGLFTRKKEEDEHETEKIDDTQNFIAQIYNNKNAKEDFDEMYALTFGKQKKEQEKVEEIEEENLEYKIKTDELKTAENMTIFDKLPENKVPEYKFIGIAFSTYIIIEMNNELYIIDQHAAHERIMYEKIKKNYYSDTNKDSQLMLLPDIINLSHKDMQIAKDNMEIFEKAGFVLEEFGENTIKLSGVPTVCIDLDNKELFLETLDEINTVARTAKQEIEEKFIATVACKAAVKANMALTKEEVDSLMKKLLVLPNPFTCPHGRPTAIRMTKTDIEKKFSRR